MSQRHRQYYAIASLLSDKPNSRTDALNFSRSRTDDLKALHPAEWGQLLSYLKDQERKRLKPMRAKITALMCQIGYTTPQGEPDYNAINAFCQARTLAKKPLLKQTYRQLLDTTNQVQAMHRIEITRRHAEAKRRQQSTSPGHGSRVPGVPPSPGGAPQPPDAKTG